MSRWVVEQQMKRAQFAQGPMPGDGHRSISTGLGALAIPYPWHVYAYGIRGLTSAWCPIVAPNHRWLSVATEEDRLTL